jgi:hypothetical protein
MHEEDLKNLQCVQDILEKDLRDEMQKVKTAGTFAPGQTKTICEAVDLMLKMKEYEEWLQGQGMSDTSRRNIARSYGYSNGYVPYGPRNATSLLGYVHSYPNHMSGHSTKDRMISVLEDQMGNVKNEYEAQMVANVINYIQNMQ